MYQNENKPKSRTASTVYGPIFLPFYIVIVSFFCQDENKTGSSFVIIGCTLSNNQKLALYKTQSREPTFFFNTLVGATCTKTWRHPNTIKLASCWWMHCVTLRLHGIKKFQYPLNTYIIKMHLANIFYLLMKALPPSYHYSLDIFIFVYIFTKSKFLFWEYICYYILFTLNFMVLFLQSEFQFLILFILLLQNQEYLQKILA